MTADGTAIPEITLYSIPLSHPARAVKMMFRQAGIEPRVVELPAGLQAVVLRALRFPRGTVPAMRIDGRRVQGSVEISHLLDELGPEVTLFPEDPDERRAVEEAERWGEAVYQHLPRRFFRWALANDAGLRREVAAWARLPMPGLSARLFLQPVAAIYARTTPADDATVRAELAALPSHLSHIDGLIAAGTLGGEISNAADYQIATTTRALMNFAQLRPLIEGRPAVEHALRICPRFPGADVPARLPEDWVPG